MCGLNTPMWLILARSWLGQLHTGAVGAVTCNEKVWIVGAYQEQPMKRRAAQGIKQEGNPSLLILYFHLLSNSGLPTLHYHQVHKQMAFDLRFRVPPLQTPEVHKKKQMEPISDTASNAVCPVLLSLDQMPKWFQQESNEWILYGYRDISGSFQASLCSLLYIHNESANIYSHLIPAVFSLLGQQYLANRYSGVTGADFTPFSIFMLTAVTCLSLSATYHTLMNHSKRVEHLCLRLDMLGVVIFILGDLMLGIYMAFWCEPLLRNIYWSMVSWSPCAKFYFPHLRPYTWV